MPRPIEDLTGRTFGSWTVLRLDPIRTSGDTRWFARCECGTEASILRSNLTRGKSTKCVECRARAARKPPKPKVVKPRIKLTGAAHHRWRGNLVGYSAMHRRVAASRGAAANHPCADCSSPAQDWSFEKVACDTRMVDSKGRPYCTHPEHYAPRCRDCHNRFDHP